MLRRVYGLQDSNEKRYEGSRSPPYQPPHFFIWPETGKQIGAVWQERWWGGVGRADYFPAFFEIEE